MTARIHPPTATDELITRLSRLEARTPTVVSCYVRLDADSRRKQAYLVDILNRVRDLKATIEVLGLDHAEAAMVEADLERVVRWLARAANLPEQAGIGIFASTALGLFETIPLPRVHRNRVAVDTRPMIAELLDARESLGHYLAVAIDRTRARFFHITAVGTQELNALVPISRRGGKFHSDRADAPGWGEHRYHQRIAEEGHRHYAMVAREIARLLRARPYEGLALFGTVSHTKALESFLPARMGARLLGAGRLNPTAITPAQVARATWALVEQAERRDEAGLVARAEAAVTTGWAVTGPRDTLRALARGQVRELIVPEGIDGGGFRCQSTGQLVLAKGDCRGRGEPIPVPHLVDHAIEDALRQGVDVIVVDDPEAAARVDGLAATLRFRSR